MIFFTCLALYFHQNITRNVNLFFSDSILYISHKTIQIYFLIYAVCVSFSGQYFPIYLNSNLSSMNSTVINKGSLLKLYYANHVTHKFKTATNI